MTIKKDTLESVLAAMLSRTTEVPSAKISLEGIVAPYLSSMKFVKIPKGSSITTDSAKSTAESLVEAAELMITAAEEINKRIELATQAKPEEDTTEEPSIVSKKEFGRDDLGYVAIIEYSDESVEMDWEGIKVPIYELPSSLMDAVKAYVESL